MELGHRTKMSIAITLLVVYLASMIVMLVSPIGCKLKSSAKTSRLTTRGVAWSESFSWFTDSDEEWAARKTVMETHWNEGRIRLSQHVNFKEIFFESPGAFIQNNWEPLLSCANEERIGSLGDGGKWICDPGKISNSKHCLVYSIGSNEDFRSAICSHFPILACFLDYFTMSAAHVQF